MPTISRLLNLCNKTLLNSRVINRSSKVYSSTSFSKWTLTFSSRRRSYSSVLIEEPSALVKKLASNISQNKDQLVHEKKQVNASDEGKFVFNQVWQSIAESCGGKEKIWLPNEIVWLMGAPGSGKGTTAPAISKARGITNEAIVISKLLREEDTKAAIDRGEMVDDKFVFKLLLNKLLECDRQTGVLIDGFPRTEVQVECLKLLYDKMLELKTEFAKTPLAEHFRRPIFRITVLYVDESESVRRQLNRGKQVREHNELVRKTGQGELLIERVTDSNETLIRARYKVFQQHFGSIMRLKKIFPFHLINADGSIDDVIRKIWSEFEYQSSLELDLETFDAIQHIPIANVIGVHARQDLVRRLEKYQLADAELLNHCVDLIDNTFVPSIVRHAISGSANVRIDEKLLKKGDKDAEIIMDILSERGYRVSAEKRFFYIPRHVDKETFNIVNDVKVIWIFSVKFQQHQIRGVYGSDDGANPKGLIHDVSETEK